VLQRRVFTHSHVQQREYCHTASELLRLTSTLVHTCVRDSVPLLTCKGPIRALIPATVLVEYPLSYVVATVLVTWYTHYTSMGARMYKRVVMISPLHATHQQHVCLHIPTAPGCADAYGPLLGFDLQAPAGSDPDGPAPYCNAVT